MAKLSVVRQTLLPLFPEFGWKRIPRKRKKAIKKELAGMVKTALLEYLDKTGH